MTLPKPIDKMRKTTLIVSGFLIFASVFVIGNHIQYDFLRNLSNISNGSYGYKTLFVINYPYEDVRVALDSMSKKNPQYSLVENLELKKQKTGIGYKNYYLGDPETKLVFDLVIKDDKSRTIILLNGVKNLKERQKWNDLNRDFNYEENEKVKKIFTTKFLAPLKTNLNN